MNEVSSPYVSIIMAAYNAQSFIAEAIQSLLDQSYKDFEILIVDDGSTDNTRSVITPFLKDSRVKYFHQKNHGQTVAKNRGINESSGEIIAFCDADDYWHKEKLEKQLVLLVADAEVGVVYSDIQAIDETGAPLKSAQTLSGPEGFILSKLLFDNFIPFGSAIIRKNCINEHGGFNENYRMGIDWDLWLRVSTSWKFGFVPEKLYFYREWSGQMSRNYKGRYLGAITILQNFKKSHPDLLNRSLYRQALSDIYANYAYHSSLYEGYTLNLIRLCFKALATGYDRLDTMKRVARALLRRF